MRVLVSEQAEVQTSEASTAADQLASSLASLTPILLATARMLVPGESEARDLTQTTLELALRQIRSLRDPAKLRPWVLAIEAREAIRSRRRLRRWISLDAAVVPLPNALPPDETAATVRAALMHLTPRVRAAVVLHYLVGLSISEAAQAMGVSQNTVKSEVATGLRRLREVLNADT